MPRVLVKICGLSTPETLEATIAAGADLAGFVFFEKSPRHIDLETARELGRLAAGRINKVALTVNASDNELSRIIAALEPDMLQLHGRETPQRAHEIRTLFRLPVIKAVGVETRAEVEAAAAYEAADILLFDAKPAAGAAAPGGAGVAFDWKLLRNMAARNWMLSGGLDPDNVAEALRLTGAPGVDVSSGVERRRGVKDEARILAFVAAVRALSSSETKV